MHMSNYRVNMCRTITLLSDTVYCSRHSLPFEQTRKFSKQLGCVSDTCLHPLFGFNMHTTVVLVLL